MDLYSHPLSNREIDVMSELIKGIQNQEIANRLYVSEKTVKFHLTNIYKKTKAKSRSQLILKFFRGDFPQEQEKLIKFKSGLNKKNMIEPTPLAQAEIADDVIGGLPFGKDQGWK